MKHSVAYFLISVLLLLSNCTNSTAGNEKKAPYPPNKDSELTLLMRDMYIYYDSIKQEIKAGASIEDQIKIFDEIHKAVSTNPEKAKSDLYQAMAKVYASSAHRLNDPSLEKTAAFNLMVDNCMSCHQQMCPGPMVRIKKLYLE